MSSESLEHFIEDHARLQKTLHENWFYSQRESAFSLFKQTGLPTTRQ